MMWSEKYRPISLENMVGNEEARATVYDWLMNWKVGTKPLLLVGPPGVGKTTIAYAASRQFSFTLIELNASDTRTKSELSKKLQTVLTSSLLMENRMLLLDEVDGLYGRADYGGLEFLVEHIEDFPLPAILTANDEESEQVKKLGKKCKVLRMVRIPSRLAELYLRNVLEAEGLSLPDETIKRLVDSSAGDMRVLLNTAQVAAESGKAENGTKEPTYSLSQAITMVSSSNNFDRALTYFQNCNADPDEKLIQCYNAVTTSKMDEESRRRSLRLLAEANLLLGRIKATQQWRQLRYFDRLLVASIIGTNVSPSIDPLPFPIKLRIWNDSRQLKDFISLLSKNLHVSSSVVASSILGYYLLILSRSKKGLDHLVSEFGLPGQVVNVLKKELGSILSKLEG